MKLLKSSSDYTATQEYLSIMQLVAYLSDRYGITVSPKTLYQRRSEGTIPSQRTPFGKLVFKVNEIDDWISARFDDKEGSR